MANEGTVFRDFTIQNFKMNGQSVPVLLAWAGTETRYFQLAEITIDGQAVPAEPVAEEKAEWSELPGGVRVGEEPGAQLSRIERLLEEMAAANQDLVDQGTRKEDRLASVIARIDRMENLIRQLHHVTGLEGR